MLTLHLKRESVQYEREKDKREDKEASDKASLEAKNAPTILAHSLREKTKHDDLVRRLIAKRKKEVQVSKQRWIDRCWSAQQTNADQQRSIQHAC